MAALFFFEAEDGIRAFHVTGVQTCALPISSRGALACSVVMEPAWPVFMACSMSNDSAPRHSPMRSEERRVGKSVDLGGRRIIKKKNTVNYLAQPHACNRDV